MNLTPSRLWPSALTPQKPGSVSRKHMSAWLVHSLPEAELHWNQKFVRWAWNQRQGNIFVIYMLQNIRTTFKVTAVSLSWKRPKLAWWIISPFLILDSWWTVFPQVYFMIFKQITIILTDLGLTSSLRWLYKHMNWSVIVDSTIYPMGHNSIHKFFQGNLHLQLYAVL